jgi:uncharacterized membrane protein
MVAMLSAVIVTVGALAVDLGVQRVSRRDMQALADVVALDMARQLDGVTTTGALTVSPAWQKQRSDSVGRNFSTEGDVPVVVAVPGVVNGLTGDFTPTASNAIPTAVKVTASSAVHFRFTSGTGPVSRSAVAGADANASWGLGSYAAALDTDKAALLYALIGKAMSSNLNLQAIGYNGLASATLSLLDLVRVSRLNVGTVDDLLGTTVSLKNFYLAVADALTADGRTAEATLLQSLSTHVGAVLNNVKIGDLLNISQGNNAALATEINVFNLVTGAAFIANGNSAIAVQGLGLSLPLLGTVSGSLSVIQAPVHDCGKVGMHPHTEQATVGPLSANLSSIPPVVIPGLSNIGVTEPTPLSVSASLAGADGVLKSVTCVPADLKVDVTSQLAGTHMAVPLSVTAKISVIGLGIVDLVLPVAVNLDTRQSSRVRTADLPLPPYETKVSTGSGTLGLAGATATITLDPSWTAKLLLVNVKPTLTPIVNGLLPTILSSLLGSVVTPVAALVDTAILGPRQRLLGLTVAGADVFAHMPAPTCNNPTLKGK